MTMLDAAHAVMGTALAGVITHLQLHNGAPGGAFTGNVVGSRAASSLVGSVDSDGDFSEEANFTGLSANQAVTHVSYWGASSGGTCYGGKALDSGDAAANAAGEYKATVAITVS